LHRMTSMEREEKEKLKKREKKLEDEETMQQATWVKYTFPIKHQVTNTHTHTHTHKHTHTHTHTHRDDQYGRICTSPIPQPIRRVSLKPSDEGQTPPV